MKTNVERVQDYLWSVGPQGATNAQICQATGVEPHQQVCMITQELKRKGRIDSRKDGREWVFFIQTGDPTLRTGTAGVCRGAGDPKKISEHFLTERVMKYTFIAAHREEFRIESMCWVLGVKRSGYCAWRRRTHCL